MTAATMTLEIIPLADLERAEENARSGYTPEFDDLLVSIPGAGGLLHPLDVYRDADGKPKVWDGGRRLLALQELDKGKKSKLPASLKPGIPCLVSPMDEARRLASMATFVRRALHPAVEFLNYKRLFDQGLDPQGIAAACNVATPRVRQLLRLTGVSPCVLDAFQKGALALDQVEAFTLTEDHDRQNAILERALTEQGWTAWGIKNALREGSVRADSKKARFITRETYVEAGGTFLHDLFSNREDDETWANAELVERLFTDKLQAAIAKVEGEGWAWVREAGDRYDWDKGFTKLPVPSGKKWSKDAAAGAGAFLRLLHNGQLMVERGYVETRKAQASGAAPVSKAKAKPELFGFGHNGHAVMTQAATQATRVGLLRRPDAAYDAVITHLAWQAFRKPKYAYGPATTASALVADVQRGLPDVTVEGADEFARTRQAWASRLPTDRVRFCDYIADLTADEKAQLLALCFAETLDAGEAKNDYTNPARWAHLGWMARHADVDIGKAWKPDAAFLKGASKDALLLALEEVKDEGHVHAKGWPNAKKGELVEVLLRYIDKKGWTPKLLATLTDVEPGEEVLQAVADIDDDEGDLQDDLQDDDEGEYPEDELTADDD